MPSTYTVNLGIEKPATGEQSGTWGDTTNVNFDILDQAINGAERVTLTSAGSSGSPNTLQITNGATSDGRNKWIEFYSSGDLGGDVFVQLDPNDAEKIVFVRNSLASSRSILLFQGTYNSGRDLEIPAGVDMVVKFDGGGASAATVTDVFTKLRATEITTPTLTATTADINGGTIDNSVIGGSTAAAVTGTTVVANTSLNIAGDGATVTGIKDEDNMASNSATKLATQQSIKAYVDSQVGTVDTWAEVLANGATSGSTNPEVTAGQALKTNTINETSAGSGVTIDSVLLKDDVVNATDVETGSISANDGTASATIANSTGLFTITSLASSSVNIDGGAIDGTNIGTSSAGTGAFTTLSASGVTTLSADLAVNTDTLFVDVSDDVTIAGYTEAPYSLNYGRGQFAVVSSSNYSGMSLSAHSDAAINGSYFGFTRSRGTLASPSYVQAGDLIGIATAQPYRLSGGANRYSDSASMSFVASQTHSATQNGTDITFKSAEDDTINLYERLSLESDLTVFNEDSRDVDFRVESNNNANMLFVDGGNDRVGVGTTTRANLSSSVGSTAALQVEGLTAANSSASVIRNANSVNGPYLSLGKSRGTGLGGTTIVQSGDQLGVISFLGSDGTDLEIGAQIIGTVNGTPGANDMPGALAFLTTADGTATPSERMTISSSGAVTINGGLTVGTGVVAQDLTLSDNTPTISMTDTDSNADALIFTDGGTGTGALFISADHNDEAAGSYISLKVDSAELAQLKASEVIFNEDSRDQDFRVESDPNSHALFVQASNGFVGINTAVPGVELDITRITNSYPLRIGSTSGAGRTMVFADISGSPAKRNWVMGAQYNTDDGWELTPSTAAGGYTFTNRVLTAYGSTGNLVVNENSVDADFRVESNNNANMLFVDGGNDAVAFGTSSTSAGAHTIRLDGTDVSGSTDGATVTSSAIVNLANFNGTTSNNTVMLLGTTSASNIGQIASGIGFTRENSSNWGTQLRFYTHPTATSDLDALDEVARFTTSEFVVNEQSMDYDFRVESNDKTHMLFVDAGNNSVSIGTSASLGKLSVNTGISSSSIQAGLTIAQATNGADKAGAAFGLLINNGGESTNNADLLISTANNGSLVRQQTIANNGAIYGPDAAASGKITAEITNSHIGNDASGTGDITFTVTFVNTTGTYDSFQIMLYLTHAGNSAPIEAAQYMIQGYQRSSGVHNITTTKVVGDTRPITTSSSGLALTITVESEGASTNTQGAYVRAIGGRYGISLITAGNSA